MNAKSTSLYLGRFQPFHKGHLDAVHQIFSRFPNDTLLLAIGSAEDSFLPDNPLTAGERFEMILRVFSQEGISRDRFLLCPVRNIHNYALWTHHVAQLLPPFSKVFSGSPLVRQLFQESGLPVETYSLRDHTGISATNIREKLKKGESVTSLLPSSTLSFLQKKNIANRLLQIDQTGFSSSE